MFGLFGQPQQPEKTQEQIDAERRQYWLDRCQGDQQRARFFSDPTEEEVQQWADGEPEEQPKKGWFW